MSEAVAALFRSLQELFAEERAEITQRLWQSVPNIRDEYSEYEPQLLDEIEDRIAHVLINGPRVLTAQGEDLCQRALSMSREERSDLAQLLWQGLPSMYGLFGENDPAFLAELNRRMAELESGTVKAIPAEEVLQRLKEKYG